MCVVGRGLQGGSINHGSRDLIELHITYQLLKVMGYCEVAVVLKKKHSYVFSSANVQDLPVLTTF